MASVEVNQMLAAAAAACEDKKAEDIRILALDPAESGLSDYFLICTGTNDRQTVAITDEIELRLKREYGTYPNSVEGRRQGEWILMDYVDFIVHVFLPEKRAFYGLERLRKSATTLSVADLDAEIKSAIKANRPAGKKTARKATPEAVADKSSSTKKKAVAKKTTPARETAPSSSAAVAPKSLKTSKSSTAGSEPAPRKSEVAKASAKSVAKAPEKTAAKAGVKATAKGAGKTAAKTAGKTSLKKVAVKRSRPSE